MKARRGRLRTADKLKWAERTETCFPEGIPQSDCQLSHTRPVWWLENGRHAQPVDGGYANVRHPTAISTMLTLPS